jgi:5-amino-6-(5-phosphoribosylamino)uracil reductase
VGERPYVLLSAAMSLDGYIDDASPERLVLSDEADLDRVDELRAGSDAVMVGARTIRRDDPRLLVRSAGRRQRRTLDGRTASPRKVTVTSTGDLDPDARFFTATSETGTDEPPLVYVASTAPAGSREPLAAVAEVVPVPAMKADLSWVLTDLAGRGVRRLMVEGGASLLGQFLAAGLADELLLAVAPLVVADPAAPRLIADGAPRGRMQLDAVSRAGDMAVLRYLAGPW